MYATFVPLPVISEDSTNASHDPLLTKNEDELKEGVDAIVLPPVNLVKFGYAALCHLAQVGHSAVTWAGIFGRLCGIQLENVVEITDVRPNPLHERRRDPKETDEERALRLREEREATERAFREDDATLRNELLGTYQVGQFVIAASTFNVFPIAVVNQLMNLYDHGQPMVFINYDPFSTALLGKPAIHAYAPTQEYLTYHNLLKARKKDVKFSRLIKESNITSVGVLREIPIQIDVDAFQRLGLSSVRVTPLQDSFVSIQSDAVGDYMEALVNSVRSNTEALSTALEKENKVNMHDVSTSTNPLAQRIDTLLLIHHVKAQTQMLESLCNSALLNTALLREVE